MNEEFLENLLSETLMRGNRHNFIVRLKESKLQPQTLANMEPYADKHIGELLSKIVKSDYSMKNVGVLEDYIKSISKDKTFSEVFNMSSRLEGDAVSQGYADQINNFLVPMNDMEQKVSDIVKNAIREELAFKQQNSISQFSDEDEPAEEEGNGEMCPECGKVPCECQGGEDSVPQDGRGCAAGLGADPEAIANDKPSTEIDDRVDDLEEAFSHISNILVKMKSRTTNFDDGQVPPQEAEGEDGGQPMPQQEEGEDDTKSKAYYDGVNTAKKLEETPANPEEEAAKLAETYGYKAGTEDEADFIQGFMDGLNSGTEEHSEDLCYSAEYDVFYTDDNVYYYSDEYDVYADENGNVLCYSEDDDLYKEVSGETYFSEMYNYSNDNNEVDNMNGVTIYYSDEDQCFFSEFGERLDWDPNHMAYVGDNGSVYFSENGPYTESYEDFSEPTVENFSSNERVALFSEEDTKIVSYSEVDADGDLVCYSEDGCVLVRDKSRGCYFSSDGQVYFDSEDIEEAEKEEEATEGPEVAPAAPLNPYDLGLLPTGEQMAAEDNALVEPKDNIRQEVASVMANRVAMNADGNPSGFAPVAAPAPEGEGEAKEFSCVNFSAVSESDAVARYNKLQEYFSNN